MQGRHLPWSFSWAAQRCQNHLQVPQQLPQRPWICGRSSLWAMQHSQVGFLSSTGPSEKRGCLGVVRMC